MLTLDMVIGSALISAVIFYGINFVISIVDYIRWQTNEDNNEDFILISNPRSFIEDYRFSATEKIILLYAVLTCLKNKSYVINVGDMVEEMETALQKLNKYGYVKSKENTKK